MREMLPATPEHVRRLKSIPGSGSNTEVCQLFIHVFNFPCDRLGISK